MLSWIMVCGRLSRRCIRWRGGTVLGSPERWTRYDGRWALDVVLRTEDDGRGAAICSLVMVEGVVAGVAADLRRWGTFRDSRTTG